MLLASSLSSQAATVHAATTFFLDLEIGSPRLWQGVADPYLYRVEALLLQAGGEGATPPAVANAITP